MEKKFNNKILNLGRILKKLFISYRMVKFHCMKSRIVEMIFLIDNGVNRKNKITKLDINGSITKIIRKSMR